MKNQLIIFLTTITLLVGCQGKPAKTETSAEVKSCCADSTKSCCAAKGSQKTCCTNSAPVSMDNVQVHYFHNERRCATCMAVEEIAIEVVKQFADSSITFTSLLIGDPKSAEMEKKFEIDGQTLLVVGKGKISNLTNMAFMNARVKPNAYKEELKAAIEKLK